MRKLIILSLFACMAINLHGQSQYRLWFDNQTEQAVRGTGSAHIDLDVSALQNGLHQLFVAVDDADGTPATLTARVFLKVETSEALLYRYWFDDDTEAAQTGTVVSGMGLSLDVSALQNGIHTFNIAISDLSQTVIGQQSSLFVKVPMGGIVRYEYYVNSWDTLVGSETLDAPVYPYHLLADLDVSGVTPAPLRSDNFYFCIDDGEPVVMAKNDIYFRFYADDYSYIEDAAQYADLSTSEPVLAEQLEEKQAKHTAVPETDGISWFKADAETGDSVLFTVNVPSAMQLFGPDGTELAKTTSRQIRLRTADSGTYYLAVYDVSGSASQMDVCYERVDIATGMDITSASPSKAGSVFDLNGRRVSTPVRRGIYIIGHRKRVMTTK